MRRERLAHLFVIGQVGGSIRPNNKNKQGNNMMKNNTIKEALEDLGIDSEYGLRRNIKKATFYANRVVGKAMCNQLPECINTYFNDRLIEVVFQHLSEPSAVEIMEGGPAAVFATLISDRLSWDDRPWEMVPKMAPSFSDCWISGFDGMCLGRDDQEKRTKTFTQIFDQLIEEIIAKNPNLIAELVETLLVYEPSQKDVYESVINEHDKSIIGSFVRQFSSEWPK